MPCAICGHDRIHHDEGAGHCTVLTRCPDDVLRWVDSCGAYRAPVAGR